MINKPKDNNNNIQSPKNIYMDIVLNLLQTNNYRYTRSSSYFIRRVLGPYAKSLHFSTHGLLYTPEEIAQALLRNQPIPKNISHPIPQKNKGYTEEIQQLLDDRKSYKTTLLDAARLLVMQYPDILDGFSIREKVAITLYLANKDISNKEIMGKAVDIDKLLDSFWDEATNAICRNKQTKRNKFI